MITCCLNVIQNFSCSEGSVCIDQSFNNLLQLFLADHKVNFQCHKVFRLGAIHESDILRNDLIKQKTSKCRFYYSCFNCSICSLFIHSDMNSGLQSNISIFICQNSFINILEEFSFSLCPRSLLCQIINTQNHILCRNVYRSTIRRF